MYHLAVYRLLQHGVRNVLLVVISWLNKKLKMVFIYILGAECSIWSVSTLFALDTAISVIMKALTGLRQANLVLIAYASSEGSGEPAHLRSLARTFAACSYKQ